MWQPEYGKLSYSKVLDVKSPARANPGDAGIDFFVPEYNQDFFDQLTDKNKNNKVVIEINDLAQECNIIVGAQSSVLIPSGIKLNVPEGWALVAFAKSGVAVKKNLIPGACVVDHGYQGQLHISLINTSNVLQKISFGDVHGGLTAKVSNPKARKSFAARHQCAKKKDRLTAGYWACRLNRFGYLWGGKTYPGFW